METHKNAFLVGLFVIVVIVAGLGFTLWLTAAGKGETTRYRIHFAEAVGGLKIGSAVKFEGVDVGTVKELSIDPHDSKLVRVDVDVLKTTPVKASTKATLKLQGLTGDIYIDLSGGTATEPALTATSKNEIPEIASTPSTINTLMTRLPEIMEKMDRLLEKANHVAGQIDKLFSNKNINAIDSVVDNLAKHYGITEKQPPDGSTLHR